MFIPKQSIPQARASLKKIDSVMKFFVTISCIAYISVCYTCFNPIAGETIPLRHHKIGDRSNNFSEDDKPCKIEGKSLFLKRDDQNDSFLKDFFIGGIDFYVWHLQYQDNDGTMRPILTYKFKPHGGIGAVIQGTGFGIEEKQDSLIIVYTAEPYDGFTIEPGPYSNKIILQKEHNSIRAHGAHEYPCYIGWSN